MRIILLKDIENLGKKYDVKDVADGYARNFLIPRNLVKKADSKALKLLEAKKEIESKKVEQELKEIQGTASAIDGQEILMPVKIGEEEQLFESITAQKISEQLKEIGFEIKKTQIILSEPIKELGEYPVKIKFEHNLEAEIKLIISPEKEK